MNDHIETYDFLPESVVPKQAVKPPHRPQNPPMMKKTEEAIKLVVEHGIEPLKALMIVNKKDTISRGSVHNLNKHVAKWSIERPAAQKIAHSTLLKFASGNSVNGIEPKAVDVRACAERIVDQSTPVTRRTESVNINVDVCPVDLSRYM